MLRTVIVSSKVTEIFKIEEDMKRGTLVTKDYTTGLASKANGEGVDVYVVDYDSQPMGAYADMEISAYDDSMDIVKGGNEAVLITYGKGGQFATDQVDGAFTTGDYAVAKDGKFSPATTGQVSKFKYIGEYNDGGVILQRFESVDPHTVA